MRHLRDFEKAEILWAALLVLIILVAYAKFERAKALDDEEYPYAVPWHVVEKCQRFCLKVGEAPVEVTALDCTCSEGRWSRM